MTCSSFVCQLAARVHCELVRDACDLVELALGQSPEQGHTLDQLYLCVLPQHRSILRPISLWVKEGTVQFRAWPETRMR